MNILAINWGGAFEVVFFGITMVFVILIFLVLIIGLFSKLIAPKVRVPKVKKVNSVVNNEEVTEYEEGHMSAGDSAAIAMALHLFYAEVHDEESRVITIKTVERRYSPWSSKIYGLNNLVK